MRKVGKLVWYTLVVAGFAFIIFVIIGNIISHYITYRKVDDIVWHSQYNMHYF